MVKRISQNIGKRITRTKTKKEKLKPEIKWTTANIVLAIGGLNGFVSTEVQNSAFVLPIKVRC